MTVPPVEDSTGSATVWLVLAMTLAVAVAAAGVGVGAAIVARHRAAAAADAAALAGAAHLLDGTACRAAGRFAAANAATLSGCRVTGFDVTVSVSVALPGWLAAVGRGTGQARATA